MRKTAVHFNLSGKFIVLGHGKVSTDGAAVSRLVVGDAACREYLARLRMPPIHSLWLVANSRRLTCLPKAQDNTSAPV